MNYIKILCVVGLILFIPLIASYYTEDVQWDLVDYAVAGFILFATAVLFTKILKKIDRPLWRFILISALFIIVVLLWAELAVGIFNSPIAGN